MSVGIVGARTMEKKKKKERTVDGGSFEMWVEGQWGKKKKFGSVSVEVRGRGEEGNE